MVQRALERAYARLGVRYLPRAVFLQMQLVYPLMVVFVAALSLYVKMSVGDFVRLALLGCGLQLAYSLVTLRLTRRLNRPVAAWIEGARTEETTREAWRAAASFPRRSGEHRHRVDNLARVEAARRGALNVVYGRSIETGRFLQLWARHSQYSWLASACQ